MRTTYKRALAIGVHMGIPIMLSDEPGVGKTSVIRQLGKEMGRRVWSFIPAIMQPPDFLGYPAIVDGSEGDKDFVMIPPKWAKEISNHVASGGKAIIFFDEISNCAPMVQSALLNIVCERMVGDIYLGDTESTAIICAMNPKSMSLGFNLSAAMNNRYCHLKMTPSEDDWLDWINGVPSTASLVMTRHDKQITRRLLSMVAPLLQKKEFTRNVKEVAFPSRRTLTYACKALSYIHNSNLDEQEKKEMIEHYTIGLIGVTAASELIKLYERIGSIDIKSLATMLPDEAAMTVQNLIKNPINIESSLSLAIDEVQKNLAYAKKNSNDLLKISNSSEKPRWYTDCIDIQKGIKHLLKANSPTIKALYATLSQLCIGIVEVSSRCGMPVDAEIAKLARLSETETDFQVAKGFNKKQ